MHDKDDDIFRGSGWAQLFIFCLVIFIKVINWNLFILLSYDWFARFPINCS